MSQHGDKRTAKTQETLFETFREKLQGSASQKSVDNAGKYLINFIYFSHSLLRYFVSNYRGQDKVKNRRSNVFYMVLCACLGSFFVILFIFILLEKCVRMKEFRPFRPWKCKIFPGLRPRPQTTRWRSPWFLTLALKSRFDWKSLFRPLYNVVV